MGRMQLCAYLKFLKYCLFYLVFILLQREWYSSRTVSVLHLANGTQQLLHAVVTISTASDVHHKARVLQ
jgi:hypothetical protein